MLWSKLFNTHKFFSGIFRVIFSNLINDEYLKPQKQNPLLWMDQFQNDTELPLKKKKSPGTWWTLTKHHFCYSDPKGLCLSLCIPQHPEEWRMDGQTIFVSWEKSELQKEHWEGQGLSRRRACRTGFCWAGEEPAGQYPARKHGAAKGATAGAFCALLQKHKADGGKQPEKTSDSRELSPAVT